MTDLTTLYSSASPRSSTNEETLVLSDARHGLPLLEISLEQVSSLVSKWRQKERLKTTAVALVVCLNIGVDPPDVIKISPCARMECWVDPMSMQAQKALDTIGKNLQAQYERWQPRAKYKMHLDPTTEDVKKLVVSCRRTAKNERVLFHYNGHGVPRPTSNGEIWVFNKSYTQYIPLSIYDLHSWMGFPAIYVFDCSVAGQVLTSFRHLFRQQQMEQRSKEGNHSSDPSQDVIILCACSENELLPQDPEFPADLFTSCLTTPIKVALHWFCSKNILGVAITKEMIDRIPGKQTDRKTPLGELNWIFTAITDTIAWNVLPRSLFQKLFRQVCMQIVLCYSWCILISYIVCLAIECRIYLWRRSLGISCWPRESCKHLVAHLLVILDCRQCTSIPCGWHGIWLLRCVCFSFQILFLVFHPKNINLLRFSVIN